MPAWLDGRMLLAVLLLCVSVLGGLLLISTMRETAPVLVVNSNLDPGHVLQEADLSVAEVKVENQLASMSFGEHELSNVIGRTLSGRVHAGEILLRPDVDGGSLISSGMVGVTVPLDADSVFAGLRPGDEVAVLVTQDADRTNSNTITLLERAAIYQVTREPGRGAVSRSSDSQGEDRGVANVTLVVPRSEAERLAHAVINLRVTLAILPPPASGR